MIYRAAYTDITPFPLLQHPRGSLSDVYGNIRPQVSISSLVARISVCLPPRRCPPGQSLPTGLTRCSVGVVVKRGWSALLFSKYGWGSQPTRRSIPNETRASTVVPIRAHGFDTERLGYSEIG